MSRFRMSIVGTQPLLMHNARLSNPRDEYAVLMKRITKKRIKTDEDYDELGRLEFLGGLYWNREVGIYVPGQNFERSLLDAARTTRSGKKVERGIFVETNENPLIYGGPTDPEVLAKDKNYILESSVKVGQVRVTRTRPIFHQWETFAEGTYDASVINLEELQEIADTAGAMIGLGDWRPRYGRYNASVEKIA